MIGTGLRSGPERATARRAERCVSQANGVRARRLREMKESAPAVKGNEKVRAPSSLRPE